MKRLMACLGLLAAATLCAQQAPPKSPPATESATVAGKSIVVTYNAPSVRGRAGHIFAKDGLIGQDPSYPIWRAGANAATKLHTEADLTIGSLQVPKGDYSLWVNIADPDHWVLVVNKQSGQWGRTYDPAQNLGEVKMTMETPKEMVEALRYTLKDLGHGKGSLTLAWENKCATVEFSAR